MIDNGNAEQDKKPPQGDDKKVIEDFKEDENENEDMLGKKNVKKGEDMPGGKNVKGEDKPEKKEQKLASNLKKKVNLKHKKGLSRGLRGRPVISYNIQVFTIEGSGDITIENCRDDDYTESEPDELLQKEDKEKLFLRKKRKNL
jgi:hypothetical protein